MTGWGPHIEEALKVLKEGPSPVECGCGCGQILPTDSSPWKNYIDRKHKKRAHRKRYRLKHRKPRKPRRSAAEIGLKQREYYLKNRDRLNEYGKSYRTRKKYEVFRHYCNGEPHCQWPSCDVSDMDMLTIDHKDANAGGGGHAVYSWIVKNNFPNNFQVLCANHQFKKEAEFRRAGGRRRDADVGSTPISSCSDSSVGRAGVL